MYSWIADRIFKYLLNYCFVGITWLSVFFSVRVNGRNCVVTKRRMAIVNVLSMSFSRYNILIKKEVPSILLSYVSLFQKLLRVNWSIILVVSYIWFWWKALNRPIASLPHVMCIINIFNLSFWRFLTISPDKRRLLMIFNNHYVVICSTPAFYL